MPRAPWLILPDTDGCCPHSREGDRGQGARVHCPSRCQELSLWVPERQNQPVQTSPTSASPLSRADDHSCTDMSGILLASCMAGTTMLLLSCRPGAAEGQGAARRSGPRWRRLRLAAGTAWPTRGLPLPGKYLLQLRSLSQMTLSESTPRQPQGKRNSSHSSAPHVPPGWGTAVGDSLHLCLSNRRKKHWWQAALDPSQELIRNSDSGASLAIQWLKTCLPTQSTQVQSLVWEDPICHKATQPAPQLLPLPPEPGVTATGPMGPTAYTLQREGTVTGSPLAPTGESLRTATKVQPKVNT